MTQSMINSDRVAAAVAALCAFSARLNRHAATQLLSMWRDRDGLTTEERLTVLNWFAEAPSDDDLRDCHKIVTREYGGWACGGQTRRAR